MRSALAALAFSLALSLFALGCSHSGGGGGSGSGGLAVDPANGAYLTATAGTAYIQTFTFTGWGTSATVTAPQGTPAGLTFAQGSSPDSVVATLSGTPATASTGAFELQIVAADNRTEIVTYAFTVLESSGNLAISPTTLPAAISHVLYNQGLTISGGTAPFTWTIPSGTLPPGLTLSSSTTNTNAISGTPTTPGLYPFTIMVSDGSNPAKVGSFQLSIQVN